MEVSLDPIHVGGEFQCFVFSDCQCVGGVLGVTGFIADAGMLTGVGEERSNASRRGLPVVACKFSGRKPFGPVVLEITGKATKDLLYSGISDFSLTITFGVVRGRERGLDLERTAKGVPEC